MSLVADYDSSDDESEENKNIKKTRSCVLPSANSLLTGNVGEVFNNVYKKTEEMKVATLEKHCKMVDNENHVQEINGKKICWNYRKGRCRFGSNCTFAHDSDIHNPVLNSRETNSQKQDIPSSISKDEKSNTWKSKDNSSTLRAQVKRKHEISEKLLLTKRKT